jgi:hypothetical protein
MVSEGEGLLEIIGKGLEPAEVSHPFRVGELQSGAAGPSFIEVARPAARKASRLDRIIKLVSKHEDLGIGPVTRHRTSSHSGASRFRTVR